MRLLAATPFTSFPTVAVTACAWIRLTSTTSSYATMFLTYGTSSSVSAFAVGKRLQEVGRSNRLCPHRRVPLYVGIYFRSLPAGVQPSTSIIYGSLFGSEWSTEGATFPLRDGGWHFLAVDSKFSTGFVEIYIDGTLYNNGAIQSGSMSSTGRANRVRAMSRRLLECDSLV